LTQRYIYDTIALIDGTITQGGIMSRENKVRLAADIPKDSVLHKAIEREQEMTGRSLADIIRDALVDRYQDAILQASGIHVVHQRREPSDA
jgi:hypothetical protein